MRGLASAHQRIKAPRKAQGRAQSRPQQRHASIYVALVRRLMGSIRQFRKSRPALRQACQFARSRNRRNVMGEPQHPETPIKLTLHFQDRHLRTAVRSVYSSSSAQQGVPEPGKSKRWKLAVSAKFASVAGNGGAVRTNPAYSGCVGACLPLKGLVIMAKSFSATSLNIYPGNDKPSWMIRS